MAVEINTVDDWHVAANDGLRTVVDPMVVRCGEVFLGGAAGANSPEQRWELLAKNVHALGMFFDSVILNDRIPVFNYGHTFDGRLSPGWTLDTLNRDEEVLVHVNVQYQAYIAAKQEAMKVLQQLYGGEARVPPKLANDILTELAAADYGWQPHLETLEGRLPSDQERSLAAFILGGLIFATYAQTLNGEHVLQPNRSRLMLALSLRRERASESAEEALFRELKTLAKTSVTDLPWRPTFFPYLLATCDTPEEVVARALVLRGSGAIEDYKAWLADALDHWETNGELVAANRDIQKIKKGVEDTLANVSAAPKVDFKVSIANVFKPAPPGGLDLSPTLSAFWGWAFSGLPGNRYRKLLTRALVTDHQYEAIANRLRTVWGAGQGDHRPARGGNMKDQSDRTAIVAVIEGLIKAENAADAVAAERLLAADFSSITRGRGVEQDRAGLLAELGNPKVKLDRKLEAAPEIRQSGDLAVVRSVVTILDGSPPAIVRFRNTHVLQRVAGSWKCVSWQVTKLA